MNRCRLQYTVGRIEECPEERCPFWEPGGRTYDGRCVFDEVDVGDNVEFASWLLRMRKRLEAAHRAADAPDAG